MTTVISSEVRAGCNNHGEYEQVKKVRGAYYSRAIQLFTHGPNKIGKWKITDPEYAAHILSRADEPVPAAWAKELGI